MFEAWETFYLLIGTAAAALIAAMFVVTTLTAEMDYERIDRGTATYITPTVAHFGEITLISGLLEMPSLAPMVMATAIALAGLIGLGYAVLTLRRMRVPDEFYHATGLDLVCFAYLPALTHAGLLAGGIAIPIAPALATNLIGIAILVMLLVAVRNAWDVAVFAVITARSQRTAQSLQKGGAPKDAA